MGLEDSWRKFVECFESGSGDSIAQQCLLMSLKEGCVC